MLKSLVKKIIWGISLIIGSGFIILIISGLIQSRNPDYYNQLPIPLINKQIGSYTFSLIIWFVYLFTLQLKLREYSLPYFLFTYIVWDGQSVFAVPIDYNPLKPESWIPYSITHPLYLVLLSTTFIFMLAYHNHYQIKLNPYLLIFLLIIPSFFVWVTAPYIHLHFIPELTNSILLCILFYQGVTLNVETR